MTTALLIALIALVAVAISLYGLAMIWQDELQREEIRIELDNRYGDRV
jgi:hypothetical protein